MHEFKEIEKKMRPIFKELDPCKVILFGSYAWGKPTQWSDVDLLIVTKDTSMPSSFKQKNSIYLKWAMAFREIEKDIPVDLIVHTLPMHEKFIELNSSFSSQIINKGKIIKADRLNLSLQI
jgi:predicted nucleotidyltransferase